MDITAEVKSIQKLADYFFIVPDYQREYVWLADTHVIRFLEDINDEFEPGLQVQSNYFIGSTIIVKREDGMYDVVDGQQRLTTIVIALCTIRDTLSNLESDSEEIVMQKEELLKIVKELLYKYELASKRHTPRLTLQYPESKDYLNTLISDKAFLDTLTPSIHKMKGAYTTIKDFLTGLLTNDDSLLINFISYFLTNVEMVIIKPDNLGSALKIFETINERGVGLNAMDLLKNLLFSSASEADFTIIKQTWKEMLSSIHESGEADKPLRFLRYFLMARYHSGIIREDQIYKWMISDTGKSVIKYKNNPVGFVRELKAAAAKYAIYIKATTAIDADSVYPAITGIGYLSKKTSRQHLVLLLALKDNIDLAITNLLARNVESLVFYYAINHTLTKSYEERFANWASRLRKVNTIPEIQFFLQEEFKKELDAQQNKFNISFSSKNQGDLQPQYRIKYVLGKVEHYVRTKVNFPLHNFKFYQSQQLEHILPQNGNKISLDKFPKPLDYETTKYRLGNLTLVEAPINQSINHTNDISNNQWFDTKLLAYKNSDILLTTTLSQVQVGNNTAFNSFVGNHLKSFDHWDMSTVAERQEIIRKLILQIWKLEL